jgi:hypothetical protein
MAPAEAERLGELLIEEGALTREEVARAISEGGIKGTALAAALEGASHIKRADLAAFLASDFRPPVLEDLRRVDFNQDAVRLVPEDVARRHELIPVAKIANVLCVAKPNYLNRAAVQELRKLTQLKVKVLLADEEQVRAAIERVYRGRRIELPPPREAKPPETTAIRAIPPPVEEQAALEAIPLISMPEDEPQAPPPRPRVAPAPARPAALRPAGMEEPVEILSAMRVSPGDFSAAAGSPFTALVVQFEETFQAGKAVTPHRAF